MPKYILSVLIALTFINISNAQILLEEDFDTSNSLPTGWIDNGNVYSSVTSNIACSNNSYRMNLYSGNNNSFLDSPDIPRGTLPGKVKVSFDMQLSDYANASILTGTGTIYVQLFINGTHDSDIVSINPITLTNGCINQTIILSNIPSGASFKIRFLGIWSTGDWAFVLDNFSAILLNDDCEDAVLLPQTLRPAGILDENVADGTLEDATASQTACKGTANDDVWYKFVANKKAVSVTVLGGDVVVELFSGSCGNLVSLACKDQYNESELFDYYGTSVGETYYVRIYSFGATPLTGSAAEFRIQIGTPKVVNDECVAAETLTQSSAFSCGTNFAMGSVESATESQAACTGNANDDVWYTFEATSTDFSVYLESGDFVVQLFEGNCGNLTSLICSDLFPVSETFNYNNATIGNTYYMRVYSFGNSPLTGTAAEFGICVFTTPPVPSNNDCANAEELPVDLNPSCSSETSGTTNGASRNESVARCSGINGKVSVWYSFMATDVEQIITLSNVNILNGSANDISSFEVFSGTCGSLNRIYCSGQLFGSDPGPITVTGLTQGITYLLRVIPVNPFHTIDFNICISTTCPAAASNLQVSNITNSTAILSHNYPFLFDRTSVVTIAGGGPYAEQVFAVNTLQAPAYATGLSPDTDYDYYVVSCEGSIIAGPVSFTTCPALATNLSVTDVKGTSAVLNFSADGEERDLIIVEYGDIPVFGNSSNHVFFTSTTSSSILTTGLSSNTKYDFYVGQACPETFVGPITFTTRPSCGDVIYDSGGPTNNYANNEDYIITICPETANQTGGARRVSITFDEFDTQGGVDGIEIYDGEDILAPLISSPSSGTDLWTWDKANSEGTGNLESVTVFTSNSSGCITLRYVSDNNTTAPGFKATINCDLTSDIFEEVLTAIPTGIGAITADKAMLSTASGFMYYLKEGSGTIVAFKVANTGAQVPINRVSMVAGSGASNLGINGCGAPYNSREDWWVLHRTWSVDPLIFNAAPIEVRMFYTDTDFNALSTASGFTNLTHEDLSPYKINLGWEADLTVPGNNCHQLVPINSYQDYDPGSYFYSDFSNETGTHQVQLTLDYLWGGGGIGAGSDYNSVIASEVGLTSGNSDLLISELGKGILLKNVLGDQYRISIDGFGAIEATLDNISVASSYLPTGDLYINNSANALFFKRSGGDYLDVKISEIGAILTNIVPNIPINHLEIESGDLGLMQIDGGISFKTALGDCWKLYIDNDGEIKTTMVTCHGN
ncbi:CUB domain-containing protein [Portibacter lacus]|uniref:CUB domain-containing protein n=1 Tax=Portibacter lacus TaxID=1099794 RepID=A0AA37SSR9_9BACT|nr:hypothetical protein [Portibacter lacus]GLR17360.1 hypothetical protein GCM10007940_19750 [Portibacter lacus]